MKKLHNLRNGKITKCQVCGNQKLKKIINLGKQPPCDSLVDLKDIKKKERKYPLKFLFCNHCLLGQIDYVVPKGELFFSEYPYRSGITKTLVEKLYCTSDSTISRLKNIKKKFCVDIGSNDGTLLKGFKRYGYEVQGVEATNIAKIANSNGIDTIQGFFDENLAKQIVKQKGCASVVTATNVFAHVPNMYSIMKGIDELLDENGIFVSESHYLFDLIESLQYDAIYHEHLKYYSLKSLIEFFKFYNFEVFDIEFIKNYGGSIRVFTCRKGRYKITNKVEKCLESELSKTKNYGDMFESFYKKVKKNKKKISDLVNDYHDKGKKVIGIGCPGRCSTMINYCSISKKKMHYIAEQSTSLKINKFLPGAKIPIIDEKEMFKTPPDLAILLSWHYSDEIIKILRGKGFKSKILVPLPELKII
ncbi:MAG: methyltransferase [Flavobacteriaceae bacterium]|nr:methyltransferase [Flavobacteriaceae bacterium]|tara:strand:+ start:7509 stop:8762 length:1254 start_codon:yes stop_codon:yes gene_type:complete